MKSTSVKVGNLRIPFDDAIAFFHNPEDKLCGYLGRIISKEQDNYELIIIPGKTRGTFHQDRLEFYHLHGRGTKLYIPCRDSGCSMKDLSEKYRVLHEKNAIDFSWSNEGLSSLVNLFESPITPKEDRKERRNKIVEIKERTIPDIPLMARQHQAIAF